MEHSILQNSVFRIIMIQSSLKKIIKERTYSPRKKDNKKDELGATNEKTNDKV